MKEMKLPMLITLFLLFISITWSCKPENKNTSTKKEKKTQSYKYEYQTVPNDPMDVKIYTLENGLKIYMSINKDAPRIQTFIATRAGSKNDPADATGLAHYLEHMLFKGTSKIGRRRN